ncbi:MAG: hypothetical protein K0R64_3461 [Novosphingobium lindaniclasticum]|jgi:OOP family OmpA-OmpF porin|uniref:OmpA-like domain-containing protein n=1 Tax=Novosphingobium lindaniclasticum LE124 TaxID=1096930 RepID=T0I458_9SPHN|nr:OmpA family protein [Novosphingobium lindaniclasticum]EQB19203.1 hypothetical protein L284_02915 [Novosphingobium lindaniclasticum LE124]MDF2640477.1 hypothetical protein [Novosphingobium lindaniclasticum]
MRTAPVIVSSILAAALCGCHQPAPGGAEASQAAGRQAEEPDQAVIAGAITEAAQEAKKSIIRADVETGPTEAPPIERVHLVVPYPAKGAQPDEAGRVLIDGVLATPAYQAGGAITIWGHSDSKGSDADNLAASRRRAVAARDYLEKKGVDARRITVIALGEARPIAPNRKLDGSDDLDGRAKNRRVEIEVLPPQAEAAADGAMAQDADNRAQD